VDVLNLAMISVWSYVFTAVRNGRCVVRAGGETDTGKVHMGNYDPNGIGTGQGFLEGNARHEGGAACDAQHATAAQPERGVRVWPSPRPAAAAGRDHNDEAKKGGRGRCLPSPICRGGAHLAACTIEDVEVVVDGQREQQRRTTIAQEKGAQVRCSGRVVSQQGGTSGAWPWVH